MKAFNLKNRVEYDLMLKCVRRSDFRDNLVLHDEDPRFMVDTFSEIKNGCGYEAIVKPGERVQKVTEDIGSAGGGWRYFGCPECGSYLATFIRRGAGKWKLRCFSSVSSVWEREEIR